MRKYYRSIIFTRSPLESQFRFEDKFQILPIISDKAPTSPYCRHFPLFLEYFIDYDQSDNAQGITLFEDVSAQQVVEHEIINLLSVVSNHRFFKYHSSNNHWAVMTPNVGFDNLTPDQTEKFNNQTSSWSMSSFLYPELRKDLYITDFTEQIIDETPIVSPYTDYFLKNPIDDYTIQIKFPETIYTSLKCYYTLSELTLNRTKSIISLICDGIDIIDFKRSLGFLSFVSAIEALVGLEISDKEVEYKCDSCKTVTDSPYKCTKCGSPIWGIKAKFREFLSKFVSESSKSITKYNKIYNLRSQITHQGQLFIGDYEFSFKDLNKKENDWLMRLETLQLARLSLNNWLRYEEKASR